MFKATPSFKSAMAMFTKAQEELKAAEEVNDAALADAQAKVDACAAEKENITRVSTFFQNLLNG